MNKIILIIIFLIFYFFIIKVIFLKKRKEKKLEIKELKNNEIVNINIEFDEEKEDIKIKDIADFVLSLNEINKKNYKSVKEALTDIKKKIELNFDLQKINFNKLINIKKIEL